MANGYQWLVRGLQCVELCRGQVRPSIQHWEVFHIVHVQGALLAVEKTVSPLECSCLALDPGTLPSTGPCDGKTYQVGRFYASLL